MLSSRNRSWFHQWNQAPGQELWMMINSRAFLKRPRGLIVGTPAPSTQSIAGREAAATLVAKDGAMRPAQPAKGSRTCTYPEPRSNAKAGSSSKSAAVRSTEPVAEESSSEDGREDTRPIKEEDAQREADSSSKQNPSIRKQPRHKNARSKRPHAQGHKQPLPSIEQSEHDPGHAQSPESDRSSPLSPSPAGMQRSRHPEHDTPDSSLSPEKINFSHLPSQQRFLLEYLQKNITYHHYFFRHDADFFLHNILIEQALSYEPLLHALVGFAAFQWTVKQPDGKIQDFLGYYNRSVSLLLKSLKSGQPHTDATLLTILQLACIEEYLGDWVNLVGHQKAACSMLTELYTVESIMENELRRKLFSWYSRFELFAGFMSGYDAVLGREWFAMNEQYYIQQVVVYPEDINLKLESAVASHRVLALDMVSLFAKLPRGAISVPDFQVENERLAARIKDWKQSLEPLCVDQRYLVGSFEGAPKPDKDDIVDPYRPGGLFKGPLWTMNFLMMDWLGTNITHAYQTALLLKQMPPPGLVEMALEICRLFEAIQLYPGNIPGSVLSAQAGLGVAVLFLPRDERHTMWCRRKLAIIEAQGYTYPLTLRHKMADTWGIPEIRQWWLPNDEGYPPIVRSIRSFIEERTSKPSSAGDQDEQESIREMKGLFDKLNVGDGSSKNNDINAKASHGRRP
ncbi:MAG: hypothetical protein Q9220_007175 [cf. Caloplaca sp. 1 TL-2023]